MVTFSASQEVFKPVCATVRAYSMAMVASPVKVPTSRNLSVPICSFSMVLSTYWGIYSGCIVDEVILMKLRARTLLPLYPAKVAELM